MERLRLGLDYRPALLTSSGIGRAVRELSRALADRPVVDLHLFGHSFSAVNRTDATPGGAVLHRSRLPGRTLPWLARLGVGADSLCGGVPLFHWTDYVHPPVRRARVVLTVHDLAFAEDEKFHGTESAELLERTRSAARRAAVVLTPSHATAEAAQRHLGVAEDRLRVIPFGVDHVPAAAGAGRRRDRPYLLTIGTIEPRKNHLGLLEAWRRLAEPRPELVVVGARGWECDDIVTALEKAQREGGLVWHERLEDAQVFELLRGAAALVYPSWLEGFGFPPLEALAVGTPVVASNTPALRETLGGGALFCDPGDPAAIARAIEEVVADESVREDLRHRGAARARELSWERCAEAHVRVYRDALAGPSMTTP